MAKTRLLMKSIGHVHPGRGDRVFVLAIRLEDAGFDGSDSYRAVADALRAEATRIQDATRDDGTIWDANGNTVGAWGFRLGAVNLEAIKG